MYRSARVLVLWLAWAATVEGEIRKFDPRQPGTRNLGVWRLTNDAAVRDEGNYHNIQCWSPNGRYTCYTRWGGNEGPGGKASAEVHVVDLLTGADRLVDKGINPRWASRSNHLFYCHWTGDGKPPQETGTQVIRYDADTGEKVVITHGVECPGGLDGSEAWLYGSQRFRGRKPEFTAVRVRNQPNSVPEPLEGVPNLHPYLNVNPRYPVIKVRARDYADKIYGTNRAWYDLDGRNVRKAAVIVEEGHMCWSGDGRYLLIGNGQARGRPWDKPFPSDLEVSSWGSVGDICPCDRAGRYICGGNLFFVDTRSGDAWPVVYPYSLIIYPMEGDFSTLYDIDPKGSPDGTKIHYHSTREIEHPVMATVTGYDPKQPDVIRVDSTKGFAESGDMACGAEVVGYARKTPTSFEGLTRRKYGTRPALDLVRKERVIFPLSACVLSGKDRARARPDQAMVDAKLASDNPLLYQRQTDCYIVVTRLPFRPHLRMKEGRVELIPGENHWETRGYRLLRDGQPAVRELVAAGETLSLPGGGTYTAAAVEWSGLESPPSLPLAVQAAAQCQVLKETPGDFSWTREVWNVGDQAVSREHAAAAPRATMELMHLLDGLIAREEWQQGRKVSRVDLNEEGKPIRFQEFQDGRLTKRVYKTPEGILASEELYGPDGFKTEYVRYDTRPETQGRERVRWWYDRGRPVKKTTRGQTDFDATGK